MELEIEEDEVSESDEELVFIDLEDETEGDSVQGGGYNYVFVDGDPPNKCICHICTLPARDPQQVSCCFNIYCNSCLLQLKEKGGGNFNCPTCRQPLTGNYFKDGRADREIKSFKVYCTSEHKGCEWVGAISDIEAHLNTCPYQLLECTNKCGEKVQRQQLDMHLGYHCMKRFVVCPYCIKGGSYKHITGIHLKSCLEYPLMCCNNECDIIMPRWMLDDHIATCPKTIIPCDYSNVGCKKEMKREEQDSHNQESVNEHLQLAVKTVDALKSDIKAIKTASAEIESIKADVEALQAKQQACVKVFKITQFELKKNNNETWNSPAFYTSPGGYKMKLRVYTNGRNESSHGYISCYTLFVAGDNDDTLEWPFTGKVTIELLNQLYDEHHRKHVYYYDEKVPEIARQRDNDIGYGKPLFVSHEQLDIRGRCMYLKDDTLYFRISVSATSVTRPWLSGSSYF